MVGSWEVVIATLHTDLVHNLLVPLISYVLIKPSSIELSSKVRSAPRSMDQLINGT